MSEDIQKESRGVHIDWAIKIFDSILESNRYANILMMLMIVGAVIVAIGLWLMLIPAFAPAHTQRDSVGGEMPVQ